MRGWPITKYGIRQLKKYLCLFLISITAIFLIGNITAAIIVDKIKVNPESFIEKNGFPLFSSAEDYIDLIKSYPYDFGTQLKIHKMTRGQSFWDVAMRNHISIDTIIAANPFLDSLLAKEGTEIIIPMEDGVLFVFDNYLDLWRMSKLLGNKDSIKGDFLPAIYRLFSLDDMRFVFFKGSKPELVNNSLEQLYKIRRLFQSPISGRYTSMYGVRLDPILGRRSFHNGIDIRTKRGTPIFAAREGMVSFAGWLGRLGRSITIQHRDGYETLYGHCSAINVKKGDWVTKKDAIGTIGSTGRSTGPHLHFTIKRHGKVMNPLLFIW